MDEVARVEATPAALQRVRSGVSGSPFLRSIVRKMEVATASRASPRVVLPQHWQEEMVRVEPTRINPVQADPEKAWRASADVFEEWIVDVEDASWKEFVQTPLPELPELVIRTYSNVSPPPLAELCPLDFEMRCWWSFHGEMDEWIQQQPDDLPAPDACPLGHFRWIALNCGHRSGQIQTTSLAALCCYPDAMVRADPGIPSLPDCRKMCLVGVMAMNLDEKNSSLEIQAARLYSYMLLTGSYFGILSSYFKTFACKRLPGLDGCLWISPPLLYNSGDTLKACGFVAWQAQNFCEARAVPVPPDLQVPFTRTGPRAFDRVPILARLRKLAKEQGVANMDELVEKLSWWDDLQALSEPGIFSHNAEKGRILVSAEYHGRLVLVKFRDLTQSECLDTDFYLRRFLREVDVYMRLRDLQGDAIAEMFEYGFVRGAAICFVVLTYCGSFSKMVPLYGKRFKSLNDDGGTFDAGAEYDVIMSLLQKVHAQGVHFAGGHLGVSDAAKAKDVEFLRASLLPV
ncbi:hypothetical protein SELMODRAFT_419356 [Selaginella moellendorffii]|uniref:Uncharacterized protein n=1 Tax=Selaginella moellendorffii TaxID=88036 RepID=D8S8N4_SELML|nr:hypothetical protein SELMODRAFT_419356 [Selaginella moellendorffii]